jgi:4-amino-4-deoxy-L-arabinose transferase-like glycosyltransferase
MSRTLSSLAQHKVLGLLLVAAAVLVFPNLAQYPTIWHDEGMFLHAPKNLVLYGQYATLTSEGFTLFNIQLAGTGPAVLLPVAGVFAVWGIGLAQARAVVGVYTLLAVAGLYLLGLELGSRRMATLACLLFLAGFVRDMLSLSRAVMGEVPSLAWILFGLWAWLHAGRVSGRRAATWLVASGVLIGAAITAKPQSVLILPVLVLLWILDRAYYRSLPHWYFTLPLLSSALLPALWYIYQAVALMGSQFASNMGNVSRMAGLVFVRSNLSRVSANFVMLAQDHYLAIWGPAVAYALLRATRRDREGLRKLLVPLCIVVWLCWWALGSTGWPRFAFVPLALATIPTAMLADKVLGALSFKRSALRRLKPEETGPLFVALVLFCLLAFGLIFQMRTIHLEAATDQHEFAALLERATPEISLIESWEWPFDLLADRRFHHPPYYVDEVATLRGKLGVDISYHYDWQASGPDFLVIGPHTRLFGLYQEDLQAGCCELLGAVGEYELYGVIP